MSVGFRSFLSVEAGQFLETVIGHMNRWSVSKEIDVHAGSPGRYVLDPDDVITILREEDDEHRIYRWRRNHPFAQGTKEISRTTITAVECQDSAGWLWTEIEAADDGDAYGAPRLPFMSIPTVLRDLLGDLPCCDGAVPVATEPRWVPVRDLPDLMDYLADESRRGPVYVACQGAKDADDFQVWSTHVAWEVAGLGNTFLLDRAVGKEFNEMVGYLHSIPEGTIRTYLPGVNLDDPHDPRRHQILGTERIARNSPRRLAFILGLKQRDRVATAPLPPEAREIDRTLCAHEDEAVDGQGRVDLQVLSAEVLSPDAMSSNGAEPAVEYQAAQPLRTLTRRGTHRRLVELLAENDRLRAEVNELKRALEGHQPSDISVLAALDVLEGEVKALRHKLGVDSSEWRQQLSA